MKKNEFFQYGRWILSLIVWLAIFTSFIAGAFANNFLIGLLPLGIHKALGWIGLSATTFFAVADLMGWKTY